MKKNEFINKVALLSFDCTTAINQIRTATTKEEFNNGFDYFSIAIYTIFLEIKKDIYTKGQKQILEQTSRHFRNIVEFILNEDEDEDDEEIVVFQ